MAKPDPLFKVSGDEALKTFAEFRVIVPVFAIITPPIAANGLIHSGPAVREVEVLYSNVADEPYVGGAEAIAVPSIERIPLTVQLAVVNVFVPEFENVRLLNVVAEAVSVCATPPKLTVPVPALKTVPVPFQAVALVAFSLRMLDPPFSVPAVRVITPVKVWVNPVPRFNVPPVVPLIVRPFP